MANQFCSRQSRADLLREGLSPARADYSTGGSRTKDSPYIARIKSVC